MKSKTWIASRQQIGKLIRLERSNQKISQLHLAVEINIGQSQISKIENGIFECSIRQWTLIADYLSLPKTAISNEEIFNKRMERLKDGK